MNFEYSEKVKEYQEKLNEFMLVGQKIRTLRLKDGSDEVRRRAIAMQELKKYQ
jgi:hypothetical protein